MPPLAIHLRFAQETAAAVGLPLLGRHLGAFFLGSTAPDIRNNIGWPRERTHFTTLAEAGDARGLERMFLVHPHLAEARSVGPEVAAFVAGYRTHLVADDAWIRLVYRPYFGQESSLGGSAMANVLDRALQFEMDNGEREERGRVAAWVELLQELDPQLDIGFIGADDLARWRETVLVSMQREPSWERFRSLAEGVLVPSGKVELPALTRFLDELPGSLGEVHHHVAGETIACFRQEALAGSLAATASYLA